MCQEDKKQKTCIASNEDLNDIPVHQLDRNLYVCDFLDELRKFVGGLVLSMNDRQKANSIIDSIQHLAEHMENRLAERGDLLREAGYFKCPACGSMTVPVMDLGITMYKCCGYTA
jgi:hypothetical protein